MKRINYEMTITDMMNLYDEMYYDDTVLFDQQMMNLIDEGLNDSVDVPDIDKQVSGIYVTDLNNYLYFVVSNGHIQFEVTERDDLFRI